MLPLLSSIIINHDNAHLLGDDHTEEEEKEEEVEWTGDEHEGEEEWEGDGHSEEKPVEKDDEEDTKNYSSKIVGSAKGNDVAESTTSMPAGAIVGIAIAAAVLAAAAILLVKKKRSSNELDPEDEELMNDEFAGDDVPPPPPLGANEDDIEIDESFLQNGNTQEVVQDDLESI